ncbi:hypothetical protein NBV64_06620 [Alcaligenes sp. DN25]|uniref:hypothetical protein n=1 Tax=Alcaligenes TaxID=507 RepID=UPI002030C022|nr:MULTISPECIES: hypothetical protein [Alcaligenes]URW84016.1 hypothetical protein NBV64_06620 [Alcaligenes sp. DN25]WEA68855.1 hypothetical protein PWH35_06635 [Alcaligenes faecalis]
MRKYLNPIAVGLLSFLAVASHAASPDFSVTTEDLKKLRSTSVMPREASPSAATPKDPAKDSEFSRNFQKAMSNEEKARQAAREQQLERNRLPQLEQNRNPANRFGPPNNKKENMGIYFDADGTAATSCREDEQGKTRCKVRELR